MTPDEREEILGDLLQIKAEVIELMKECRENEQKFEMAAEQIGIIVATLRHFFNTGDTETLEKVYAALKEQYKIVDWDQPAGNA